MTSNDYALPYPEPDGTMTAGWSGSDSSRDRAVGEARSGRAQRRANEVWNLVRLAGLDGITWKEVSATLNIHHGASTGALSGLHNKGRIARLKERRGGSAIYVLPHAVNDRPTAPYGRRKAGTGEVGTGSQTDSEKALNVRVSDAFDDGWQVGYDAGVSAERPEAPITDERLLAARQEGYVRGRATQAQRTVALIEQMTTQIKSAGVVAGQHDGKCWVRHPQCALNAVVKAQKDKQP